MKVWVVEYVYDESLSYAIFSTKGKARKFFEKKFNETVFFDEEEGIDEDDNGRTREECLEDMCYFGTNYDIEGDESARTCHMVASEMEVDSGKTNYYAW